MQVDVYWLLHYTAAVMPRLTMVISLDVTRPNSCFPSGYFLISLDVLLLRFIRPNYCFPTGYFLIMLNIIILRPFFAHLFLAQF